MSASNVFLLIHKPCDASGSSLSNNGVFRTLKAATSACVYNEEYCIQETTFGKTGQKVNEWTVHRTKCVLCHKVGDANAFPTKKCGKCDRFVCKQCTAQVDYMQHFQFGFHRVASVEECFDFCNGSAECRACHTPLSPPLDDEDLEVMMITENSGVETEKRGEFDELSRSPLFKRREGMQTLIELNRHKYSPEWFD
jgi:hypothetical protein